MLNGSTELSELLFTGEQGDVRRALEGLLDFMHVTGGSADTRVSPHHQGWSWVPTPHLHLHNLSASPARSTSKIQPDSPAFSITRSPPWLPLHPTYSHTSSPGHFSAYHPPVHQSPQGPSQSDLCLPPSSLLVPSTPRAVHVRHTACFRFSNVPHSLHTAVPSALTVPRVVPHSAHSLNIISLEMPSLAA